MARRVDESERLLAEVLSLPTVPFGEGAVRRYAVAFAEARGLACSEDRYGNLLLRYRCGVRGGECRWVLAAHMDHPGFVAARQRGRLLWAEFRGGLHRRHFPGARVVFYGPRGPAGGTVLGARRPGAGGPLTARIRLHEPGEVPRGAPGVWDVPAYRRAGRRVEARACDDLAGVAAALAALDRLRASAAQADVAVLLTRAEEVGFIGALGACRSGLVPRRAAIVGIETSAAHAGAPLGGGAVIRVGDRAWTFDPPLTAFLADLAGRLARVDRTFRYQRALMAGGMCESSAFAAMGRRAAAVCIPLDNYHNGGPDGGIAPEAIDLRDYRSLVSLLMAVAQSEDRSRAVAAGLRERLLKRFAALEGSLA